MAENELVWRKSSYTDTNCVELTFAGTSVWVRDSFDRNGQILDIPIEAWEKFMQHVRLSA